jgi:hypothetical protein
VLLRDQFRYGTGTLSTHALMRGAVLHLHRLGLLPAVAEAGTPPVRPITFHLPDADTTVQIKPRLGVDALYAPRRRPALSSTGISATMRLLATTGTTRPGQAAGVIPANEGLACVFAATSGTPATRPGRRRRRRRPAPCPGQVGPDGRTCGHPEDEDAGHERDHMSDDEREFDGQQPERDHGVVRGASGRPRRNATFAEAHLCQ